MKEIFKNKKFVRSVWQLSVLIIGLLIINVILNYFFFRIDLTSEKRFTLTDYTKNTLSKINGTIYIKVYLEGDDLPVQFKKLRNSVKEMLDEFKVYGNTAIEFEFINPSEFKDKNVRFGVYKQLFDKGLIPFETKQKISESKTADVMIFPSAIVTYSYYDEKADTTIIKESGINFLKNDPHYRPESEENINNSIQALEYDLINAIQKISRAKKNEIAFIEGHGELSEIEVIDITTTLSEYYSVRRGKIAGKLGILNGFDAIVIAKPTMPFTENDKFVIDQYIMDGGKVLWLVDGASVNMDSLSILPVTLAMENNTNLQDQLFKYGARVNSDLVLDMQCSAIGITVNDDKGNPKIELFPWLYYPVLISDNKHLVTKYVNYIKTGFVSTVDTVGISNEIKRTVLLSTSKNARLETAPTAISLDIIKMQPKPSDFTKQNAPVAVLLEGSFESAFKNRPVHQFVQNKNEFVTKSAPTKMIVIGDGDIIRNDISPKGEPYPLGFDINSRKTFKGNSEFILNSLNYLCDDDGVMSLRSRELKIRLLDKAKAENQRIFWQIINTILPVLVVILFAFLNYYFRKRKYSK